MAISLISGLFQGKFVLLWLIPICFVTGSGSVWVYSERVHDLQWAMNCLKWRILYKAVMEHVVKCLWDCKLCLIVPVHWIIIMIWSDQSIHHAGGITKLKQESLNSFIISGQLFTVTHISTGAINQSENQFLVFSTATVCGNFGALGSAWYWCG